VDFEAYKNLNFFDERYFLEANSLKNPNNKCFAQCLKEEERFYTPIAYEKMGVSLLISILDYEKLNPFSRLGSSDYKSIENLRMSVANHLFNSEEKYKSSAYCQNYMKNLDSVKKFESLNELIIHKLNKDKVSKRSNSLSVKKMSNHYGGLYNSSNIIINNFNGKYFDLFANRGNVNINTNENANDAKRIMYSVDVGNQLMNSININNFNNNLCNYENSVNEMRKLFFIHLKNKYFIE
jgi:hypothetical protein